MQNVNCDVVQTLNEETLQKIYDARCLDIEIQGNERFWEVLHRTCANRKLILRDMSLGCRTAQVLTNILNNNKDLVAHLDISKNLIGDKGIDILAPAFQSSRNLVSLIIGSNDISPNGMIKLLNAFSQNCSLQYINLSTEDGV